MTSLTGPPPSPLQGSAYDLRQNFSLTVGQSVSFCLPTAFTVHEAGGLSLEIGTPGAGIPHWCAVKARRVSTQQGTEQSGNLSRVCGRGPCHKPGSKDIYRQCGLKRLFVRTHACSLSLNCTPKREQYQTHKQEKQDLHSTINCFNLRAYEYMYGDVYTPVCTQSW